MAKVTRKTLVALAAKAGGTIERSLSCDQGGHYNYRWLREGRNPSAWMPPARLLLHVELSAKADREERDRLDHQALADLPQLKTLGVPCPKDHHGEPGYSFEPPGSPTLGMEGRASFLERQVAYLRIIAGTLARIEQKLEKLVPHAQG